MIWKAGAWASLVCKVSLVSDASLEQLLDGLGRAVDLVVRAHVTLGYSRLESRLVEVREETKSLVVELAEELIRNSRLTGVDPEHDDVVHGVALVADRVGLVVSVNDVEIWLSGSLPEEGDCAGAIGVAEGLRVHAHSWRPDALDLGLEGIVDLEVLDRRVTHVFAQVRVRSLLALVLRRLVRVLHVLLLVPVASVAGHIEASKRHNWITDDRGLQSLGE